MVSWCLPGFKSQEPSLLVIGLEAGLPEPLGLLLELHVHRHPQLLLGRLARLLQDLDIVDEGLQAIHLVVRPPGDAQLRAVLLQDGEATLSSRTASSGMVCSDDLAGLRVCDRSSKVKAFSSYPARSAPMTLQGGASFSSL